VQSLRPDEVWDCKKLRENSRGRGGRKSSRGERYEFEWEGCRGLMLTDCNFSGNLKICPRGERKKVHHPGGNPKTGEGDQPPRKLKGELSS